MKGKNIDYIDASIFLAYLFSKGEICKDYIRTIGYKSHNKGIITTFVTGEILSNILLKEELKEDRPIIFEFLAKTFDTLIDSNRLDLSIFKKKHFNIELFNEIRGKDRSNDDTDALHLMFAIQLGCRFFATTDKKLYENKLFRDFLKNKYDLTIKYFKSEI